MTGHLHVVDHDATRIITLTRPDKKNALTQAMYRAMSEAINSAQSDAAIRCLLIEGSGGIFTSGNDLEDFLKAGSDGAGLRGSEAHTFLHALANNEKPLLASVEGAAIGIGTTLLLHCDYVLAASNASFATPFVPLGLVPEGASSLLAPRALGHHRAFALLVMGRKLDANDARDAGFVNEVVPPEQLAAQARKVAAEIAALPAEAVAISRRLLKPPPAELIERIDHEGKLFGERMTSKEAIAAFTRFFSRKK
ncbi:enoyl-CoA hydratase/carnithine racemase [Rhodopseudomonas rhenobacensis]|uniref:Enoyl-CoA hydratase/carnithine racemase n=1 Tax=Rhodopseudomonas rhenobacensis TaxID=87461 RepID=A0A7W7Z6D7_9BRAD|nr:enoyl-CoA hydratase-related protein [Rhodopseudomonas rhenobacensis]MBB5048849.1 enoyl-CoA hydratase/carnithine racemase [Rhodopseudomonas rhenobacensis]